MQKICLLFIFLAAVQFTNGQKNRSAREYVAVKIYHVAEIKQLDTTEQYLQASLLPALGKNGFDRIGVFKALDNDTAKDKRLYVFIPFSSLSKVEQLTNALDNSINDNAAQDYTKASYNHPLYNRIETILLQTFETSPQVIPSGIKGDKKESVYELRSYESATEALHLNKVKMFNSGEINVFQKLGFNAVFYSRVIAGSRMPNLMYMTSFENKAARDEHWKAFGDDPDWKTMRAAPEYQNNVSHMDIVFLRPTAYSKL